MADKFNRIEFSQRLFDKGKPAKISIDKNILKIELAIYCKESDGKLTVPAILGEQYNYRDLEIGVLDIVMDESEIALLKFNSADAASTLVLKVTIPTKIPGTSGDLLLDKKKD